MPSSNINHIYILVNSQVESKVLDVGDLLSKGLSVSKNEGHVLLKIEKGIVPWSAFTELKFLK